jgi:hypothetical protein
MGWSCDVSSIVPEVTTHAILLNEVLYHELDKYEITCGTLRRTLNTLTKSGGWYKY